MPLMTVSTTAITGLHYVEVVNVPQESCLSLEGWILVVLASTQECARKITTRLFNGLI
jgi:hypothetical protein